MDGGVELGGDTWMSRVITYIAFISLSDGIPGWDWMKASEKIWWTKLAAAVGVAIITLVLQVFFNLAGQTTFMLGVIIYLGLSDLLSSMNGVERGRGLKIGVGAFFFTWITSWVFFFTIIQTMG
jgi:hypothetical protein